MKLLFDQNLSPRLVHRLVVDYPGSAHVSMLGLGQAFDVDVWAYARDHGFTIVTKDVDFSDLTVLFGFPPKVVWLRLGNCPTATIEDVLRVHKPTLEALDHDPNAGIVELG